MNATRRQASIIILLVGAAAPVSAACAAALQQEPPGQFTSDYFYSNGQRIEISLSLDSIAIIGADTSAAQQVAERAGRFPLAFARAVSENVLIFRVMDRQDRRGLANRARALRDTLGQGVQTGLLLRTSPGVEPFFLTDEFIVQFRPDVDRSTIDALNADFAVEVISQEPLVTNQFLLRVTDRSPGDALAVANEYHENPLTEFAHPNLVVIVEPRGPPGPLSSNVRLSAADPVRGAWPQAALIPNDALFANQWHLNNTGQGAGTVDADVDAPEAWTYTTGAAGSLIAVLDGGFDMTHPDLTPNLFTNAGEVAGNGVDDDGNGVVDDVNGWDFAPCPAVAPPAGCGDANPTGPDTRAGRHGTSVAGAAAARGNNTIGVSGSCMNCTYLPVRITMNAASVAEQARAFNYAAFFNAGVITNSWGYTIGTPATTAVVNAINNAVAGGSTVLFAMNTTGGGYLEDCQGATPDISSLANVIAVSASSNSDSRTPAGYGNCMDLVAPTDNSGAAAGTLFATTTDMQGNAGYNNNAVSPACPSAEPAPPPANSRDYTLCFGGTSFATPLTAGVAGLVLSASPGLTPQQVQRLLQDTADKIEDSAAQYDSDNGFSSPTTPPSPGLPVGSTHGYGRLNAYEAVNVVAAAAAGGQAGVDIMLRDNRLDWGNTQQPSNTLFEPVRGFIGHWRSMDIKIDAGPTFQIPPTAATFDAFTDETPSAAAGVTNRVYVRVRNRGPTSASSVTVRLFWTQFGTALPNLPPDFWTVHPANSTDPTNQWNPLLCSGGGTSCPITTAAYSGASVAGTGADVAQIVQFDFPAPIIDPTRPNHFCILAIIDTSQDRPLPLTRTTVPNDFVVDWLTPNDNNVSHRNYHNLSTTTRSSFAERFFVRNPHAVAIQAVIRALNASEFGFDLTGVTLDQPFTLAPGEERLVEVEVHVGQRGEVGEITFIQERTDVTPVQVMGGATYVFYSDGRVSRLRRALSLHAGSAFPFGVLNNTTNPGPTVSVDFVQPLGPKVAFDLRAGYSLFPGSSGATDVDIWNFSGNLKVIPTLSKPWVFLNGGLGAYYIDSSDWEGGFNLGVGLGQPLGAKLDFEATLNYHRTFTAARDLEFGKVQVGLIWSL